MGRELSFLIVGTPRSGTTLVQRLACEIPGVAVPPETHFLYFFAADLYRRRRFPLDGGAIRDEIALYAALDNSKDLAVDADAVAADLGERCDSVLALFAALVRHLAGPAEVYGEKTPAHIVWWEKLAAASPALKFVVVVRHPAAVVASWMEAWPHESWAAAAERWRLDQQRAAEMLGSLGPRALLLRYEDVVADPAGSRARLATFLDRDPPAEPARPRHALYLPWETWKERTLDDVDPARAEAWRGSLTPDQVAHVALLCRAGMDLFGYDPPRAPVPGDAPEPSHGAAIERCREERTTKLREADETRVD